MLLPLLKIQVLTEIPQDYLKKNQWIKHSLRLREQKILKDKKPQEQTLLLKINYRDLRHIIVSLHSVCYQKTVLMMQGTTTERKGQRTQLSALAEVE